MIFYWRDLYLSFHKLGHDGYPSSVHMQDLIVLEPAQQTCLESTDVHFVSMQNVRFRLPRGSYD
jgi:hypothetical protein